MQRLSLKPGMRVLGLAVCLLTAATQVQAAREVPTPADCGSLENSVGPFDYRKHRHGSAILDNVEHNHFGSDVENLVRGQSSYLAGDLEYVLRAFPNHHRALLAVSRLSQKRKAERLQGLRWPATCMFVRAIEFAPDDAVVHSMYSVHLSNRGNRREAIAEIEAAIKLGANDANTLYNAGLVYFDVGDYDKALSYAKKAYQAGYPLPGLRNKLQAVGRWSE